MSRLRLKLLGGYSATLDGDTVASYGSRKAQALLAYLAVEVDRSHRRDSFAALLWPDHPERSARTNLRNALANLRTALDDRDRALPILDATRQDLRLNPDADVWVDVWELDNTAQHAATGAADVEAIQQALDLYTGDFLAGFTLEDSVNFDDWSSVARERIRRQTLRLFQRLAGQWEAAGDQEKALACSRRLIELEPWSEDGHRAVMRLLALGGRRTAALAQYDSYCTALSRELGVKPSKETTALYDLIRTGEMGPAGARGSSADAAAAASRPPYPHTNLPAPSTLLIGCELERERIAGLLTDPACRLLTLVGPGGIGKTRLALAAGSDQVAAYSDGVFFVQMASLNHPADVVPAIAQAAGFTFPGAEGPRTAGSAASAEDQLRGYLRGKQMLLVLDNAEHLLSPSGDNGLQSLVLGILEAAPTVTVLATSRVRLGLQREHLLTLSGLDHQVAPPGPASKPPMPASMRLFQEGAQRVDPAFCISDRNAEEVAAICQLCAGLPLGIILASAWVDMLAPAEIIQELNSGDAGIDLLSADWQDLPERHRSLRHVFDGSWRLLNSVERAALARASVFHGSLTREAARVVAEADIRTLRALVAKSMLQVTDRRYDIHPLLRQYLAARTEQEATRQAREAHGRYFAGRVNRAGQRASRAQRSSLLWGRWTRRLTTSALRGDGPWRATTLQRSTRCARDWATTAASAF